MLGGIFPQYVFYFHNISRSQLFRIITSHLCLACNENMLPRREFQLFRSSHRPLVRNRRNASSRQALQESQSSHLKEWFHASLVENQFLVRPTNRSTTSDTYDPSVLVCVCITCTNCFFFGHHWWLDSYKYQSSNLYLFGENQLISNIIGVQEKKSARGIMSRTPRGKEVFIDWPPRMKYSAFWAL